MQVSGLPPHLVNTKFPIPLPLTYPDSHRVVADPHQFEAIAELRRIFKEPFKNLEAAIHVLAFDAGVSLLNQKEVFPLPVFQGNRMSGYRYSYKARMIGELRIGFSRAGHIVIQSCFTEDPLTWSTSHYFKSGHSAFSSPINPLDLEEIPKKIFEPRCPILNFFYELADREYSKMESGQADTVLLNLIQKTLRNLEKRENMELSFSRGIRDPSLTRLNQALLNLELDPVLNFSERKQGIHRLKMERSRTIRTKCRVHGVSPLPHRVIMTLVDLRSLFKRALSHPWDNLGGVMSLLFLEPLKAFFKMVKSNLGYSIALAVYSPFTFFFITQPMNPHAMRAVGAVRTAAIEMTDSLKSRLGVAQGPIQSPDHPEEHTSNAKSYASTPPKTSGILLSSDIPEVDQQKWDERMSHFKAMQIAYESNLEIAPRLGRLEQVETQLNWPILLESAWMETSRYLAFANFLLSQSKDYPPAFIQWIHQELKLLDQVQLYLWDRNIRFILDHPFIVMDESQEQPSLDLYARRNFAILREMTRTLLKRHPTLLLPQGYDRILELSRKFDLEYHSGSGILDRLKKNSSVFSLQSPLETVPFRSNHKRTWEVLYLQQNHAQEAANSGLQLYVWSVRTLITLLQTWYSNKREELSILSLAFKSGGDRTTLSKNSELRSLEFQSESILHQIGLEFASVRKELNEDLKKDIEASQRKTLIDGMMASIAERDRLIQNKGEI